MVWCVAYVSSGSQKQVGYSIEPRLPSGIPYKYDAAHSENLNSTTTLIKAITKLLYSLKKMTDNLIYHYGVDAISVLQSS